MPSFVKWTLLIDEQAVLKDREEMNIMTQDRACKVMCSGKMLVPGNMQGLVSWESRVSAVRGGSVCWGF